MPSVSAIFSGVLEVLGIIDWLKQVLHDHDVRTAQQKLDVSAANAATVQEVARIQVIKNDVQNMSHQQLIDDYVRMRKQVAASSAAH